MNKSKLKPCKYCGAKRYLQPSAQDRANSSGESAKYYTELFNQNPVCNTCQTKQWYK